MSEIDALLYLPGHPRGRLEHALRIPALSAGWKGSLEALVAADSQSGNAGLAPISATAPAWTGFRLLRVARVERESADVLSFVLEAQDRSPLPTSLPGQFLAFKIQLDKNLAPLLRSYSMSGLQGVGSYRISVKRAAGLGSQHFHDHVRIGDMLQVSAPRGSFTLVSKDKPVVLLSAGIGVTPVLSTLHALAAKADSSAREIWWCYGARNGREHPFAAEARGLLKQLPESHSLIVYSQPDDADQPGRDSDVSGHLSLALLQQRNIPRSGDFYLCGPAVFLEEVTVGLKTWGAQDPASIVKSLVLGLR